jgi:threonine aldolase
MTLVIFGSARFKGKLNFPVQHFRKNSRNLYMKKFIDLRSDTVTRPSEAMRKAMYEAEVGDDVFGEDPTVNALQEYAAELTGKEAALFVSSGVMGNQLCLHIHTHPYDEVICEADAHIFHYESGSPAALSGIQIMPVAGFHGVITPDQIEPLIRPESAYYMPRTKLIEIENTHNRAGGTVHPIQSIAEIGKLAKKYKLGFHMDGARIWNASVASGIAVKEYAKHFDSVSCCLSKGLGAPVGSFIAGTKEFIHEAFRVRKAWGGGMRQIGIIAAAGLYALKNNIERLAEDHANARLIAESVANSKNAQIDMDSVQTNIISFRPLNIASESVMGKCAENGILISAGKPGYLRIVTHLDVSRKESETAALVLSSILN